MALYDILILGNANEGTKDRLRQTIVRLVTESGVDEGAVELLLSAENYEQLWDPKRPTAVACFSDLSEIDIGLVNRLAEERVPIIPIAQDGEQYDSFPELVRSLNGVSISADDPDMIVIASAMLDCIGLLREQRRVFVSYRRDDARKAAIQLHDGLSGRGFNVFLDTHAIRPGRVFQDDLWQYLCDSDVVVMLDTPGYFESKWTREEFGRAQAFGVHLLRLVWPGHKPLQEVDLSDTLYLDPSDLVDDLLAQNVLDEVLLRTERLRARGIAARHIAISGKLLVEVEGIGGTIVGAGAYRTISIELIDGSHAWIYPVVGVPTAQMMNNIARRAATAEHAIPFLVFDHQGIAEPWLDHLDWLDRYIPEVDFMRVSEAGRLLKQRAGAA